MLCELKCILVKVNGTTQSLDCFKDYFLVFMDRFDSSPAVSDFLRARKTKAVGTFIINRKELPRQNAVSNKTKSDECVFMRRDHLLCFKWKDTRDVLCLSTAHKMTTTNVEVQCKNAVKTKSKPDAILDYNLNKTGVDRADQIISYYLMKRKKLKWWKKLFFSHVSHSNCKCIYTVT